MGVGMLAWQWLLLLGVLALGVNDGWSYESVGFRDDLPVLISLCCGVCCYIVFLVVLEFLLRVTGTLETVEDGNMAAMASITPRKWFQKICFVIGICVFNPVIEEILFRGILVHQFSLSIGNSTLPIIIGLAANLGNHAYQGRTAMTTHLPFYFIVVGLMYSPTGLMGAIGFHIAGDVVPVALLRRDLRAYRERQQRKRL